MDLQTITEYLTKFIPIITIIITAFIINPFNSFINRKTQKIKNTKEIEFIIDKLNDEFKNDFVLNDFKENYFYLQTGIKTNQKSINSLIKLKDNLKRNYTWKHIKLVMPFLNFSNTKIEINVSKFNYCFTKFTTFISLIFLFISLIFFFVFLYNSDFTIDNLKRMSVLFLTPFICAYYLIHISTPLRIAIDMDKVLGIKENGEEK